MLKKEEGVTNKTHTDISKTDLAAMQQGEKQNLSVEKQSCSNGSQRPSICGVL